MATVTEVSICSNALAKLGEDAITALTDNTVRARLCNRLYEPTRDAVLRDHIWNFALKRQELAQDSDEPAWGYSYSYTLPSDCLRVIKTDLDEDKLEWKVEGRAILTDESSCSILFVKRETDPQQFDVLFTDCLQARLAFELCHGITGKQSLASEKWQEYNDKLRRAKGVDGQEGTTEIIESSELSDART